MPNDARILSLLTCLAWLCLWPMTAVAEAQQVPADAGGLGGAVRGGGQPVGDADGTAGGEAAGSSGI